MRKAWDIKQPQITYAKTKPNINRTAAGLNQEVNQKGNIKENRRTFIMARLYKGDTGLVRLYAPFFFHACESVYKRIRVQVRACQHVKCTKLCQK